MKFTNLLLPATFLSGIIIPETPGILIIGGYLKTKNVFGLFSYENDTVVTFESHYRYSVNMTFNFYDLMNNSLYSQKSETCSIEKDVIFPFKNRLTQKGIRMDMHYSIPGKGNFDISTNFYLPCRETINVALLPEKEYGYEGVCFYLDDENYLTSESFDFTNTNRYITTNSRNKLDLSEVMFDYSFQDFINYKEAYLRIFDYEGAYPKVKKEGDGSIKVPLSLYNDNHVIEFSLNTDMYVNSKTLEMSSNYMDGYDATNSFYVPIGKENFISDNAVSIVIEECGFNKDKIIIPLDYFYSKRIFGACYESDYCIEGGVKE